MRIGMAGLNALYWPVCIGNGLIKAGSVQFLAAATLGESNTVIKDCLGLSPVEYAEKYHVTLYEDAEEMIEKELLDAVIIICRHSGHAELVEKLAKYKVDIYVPKTYATTEKELEIMLDAERNHNIRIAVGPTARYLPQMVAVKRAIDSGAIGEPFFLRICHNHGTIDCFHANDWYRDPCEGGPELSLGWYGIDLALNFLNQKVKTVFADYGNFTTPGSPFMDCGRISLGMENGAMAAFDMYFCNRMNYPSWQVEVIGTRGAVSIARKDAVSTGTVVLLDDRNGVRAIEPPHETPDWEMFWADELSSGKQLSLTAEYAAYVTRISLLARESARLGKSINMAGF